MTTPPKSFSRGAATNRIDNNTAGPPCHLATQHLDKRRLWNCWGERSGQAPREIFRIQPPQTMKRQQVDKPRPIYSIFGGSEFHRKLMRQRHGAVAVFIR